MYFDDEILDQLVVRTINVFSVIKKLFDVQIMMLFFIHKLSRGVKPRSDETFKKGVVARDESFPENIPR